MSYFGAGSPEEDILENCKSIQEETGVSYNQIILALAKVMQYFAELLEEE